MNKKFDLLVVGELNVDLILSGAVEPQFGQVEKLINDANLVLGSSSAIFACGAARLGLKVTFAGKVGKDQFGRFILEQLVSHQIDIQGVVIDDQVKTGLTVILNRGQDRAVLTYPGSISKFHKNEISTPLMKKCRHIHLGGYYLLDELRPEVASLFEEAHLAGLTTSLDTNFDPTEKWGQEIWQVFKHTDIFMPNEAELFAITGKKNLAEGLKALRNYVSIVAVKIGKRGAVGQHGNNFITAQSLSVKVVDTIGAGDSFDAGLIYGFLHEWELERSLKLACVCGSLSTRGAGGTSAQPNLSEANQWL